MVFVITSEKGLLSRLLWFFPFHRPLAALVRDAEIAEAENFFCPSAETPEGQNQASLWEVLTVGVLC